MIRMLGVEDADAYVAHVAVHDLEPGTEGDLPMSLWVGIPGEHRGLR